MSWDQNTPALPLLKPSAFFSLGIILTEGPVSSSKARASLSPPENASTAAPTSRTVSHKQASPQCHLPVRSEETQGGTQGNQCVLPTMHSSLVVPCKPPECIEHCHSICQQEIGMKFEQKTKKQKQATKNHLKGFILKKKLRGLRS